MVSHFCIASHAYSRSARAPLTSSRFLDTDAHDGHCRPVSTPPGNKTQARLSPRGCASSQPPTECSLYVSSSPCHPGW
eukprot:5690511-Pleurochrysis_carterae.AAC.1